MVETVSVYVQVVVMGLTGTPAREQLAQLEPGPAAPAVADTGLAGKLAEQS